VPQLNGIHHLAFITADMDRLIAFYRDVFDAEVVMDLEEDGLRHVFIDLGGGTVLHPFQIPGKTPPSYQPLFERGRLDHVALRAASEGDFYDLRRRIIAAGASDGDVTDMGNLLLVSFVDPDGGGHEVVWPKPDVPVADGWKRRDWTTIDVD